MKLVVIHLLAYIRMKKLLTIIIPTYNMEKYLRNCLGSLIVSNDKMQEIEVLVINDGSKDLSSQIAHEYEEKYPQAFRVIDKENGNYGSCINRGIKEANGRYVKILDADDSFDTVSFDKFLCFLDKCNEDVVVSDVDCVDENGIIIKKAKYNFPPYQRFMINEIPLEIIEMHAITYKLDVLRGIAYHQTEGISYTDNEWTTIPLVNTENIIYFPKPIYRYLMGRYGQTIGALVKNSDQFEKVLYSIMGQLEGMGTFGKAEKYLRFRLQHILMCFYKEFLIADKCKHMEKIVAFDKRLKTDFPNYYALADDVVLNGYLPYHYIREWRNTYSNKIPYAWLHRLIANVGSRIRILMYN